MAIHLIPFVAGAVIGGIGVYFYRDEKLRKEVSRTAGELGGRIRNTADRVSGKASEGFSGLRKTGASPTPGEASGQSRVEPGSGGNTPASKKAAGKRKPAAKKKTSARTAKKD